MKVIDEKPWSHVLMEQGEDWILTLLIRTGPVENDVTIKLSENEISAIKSDKGAIQTLLAEIRMTGINSQKEKLDPQFGRKYKMSGNLGMLSDYVVLNKNVSSIAGKRLSIAQATGWTSLNREASKKEGFKTGECYFAGDSCFQV